MYDCCETEEDVELVEEDLQKFKELTGINIDMNEYTF
jgi:hypothetical protein